MGLSHPRRASARTPFALWLALASACHPQILPAGDTTSTSGPPATSAANTTSPATTAADTTSSSGASFLDALSTGPAPPHCDVFAQDCPEGQKCAWISYSDEAGNTDCVPVAPDPKQPGEPCTNEIGPELDWPTGVDDCVKGALCLPNGQLDQGFCVELCKGSYGSPYCEDGYSCVGGRTHWYCQQDCDPLLQDCPAGRRCDSFLQFRPNCEPDDEPSGAGVGEPCVEPKDCALALTCVGGLPGCLGPTCCTKWCDLTDPDFDCAVKGLTCVDLVLEQWVNWPEHLGLCHTPVSP